MPRTYRRNPAIVARDEQILAEHAAGASLRTLGERYHIVHQGVRALLTRRGVPTGGRPGRLPIPVVGPDGTVIGASLAEAAAALRVSPQAVRLAGAVDDDGVLRLHRLPRPREPVA